MMKIDKESKHQNVNEHMHNTRTDKLRNCHMYFLIFPAYILLCENYSNFQNDDVLDRSIRYRLAWGFTAISANQNMFKVSVQERFPLLKLHYAYM
ncbi:hypothetical protein Fmac_010658 [Flemingia macrophylla]|uniref:Uncharacterized protein n=1 Tax=Flemingia macrophylla TaxID=520843 RepID=A0ABD1MKY8_9FABA